MSKEAQRSKRKRNSSDRLQLMRSNLREGCSKGIRNFSDEYLKAVESMKAPEKKPEKKTESKPMTSMDIAKFNAGLKSGAAPADTLIKNEQTLSGYHDSRPIPKSNAEGIRRAELDKGKEEIEARQRNQMDTTESGRPGGSYGKKQTTNPVGGLNEFRDEYIRLRKEEKPAQQKTENREWNVSGKKQRQLNQRLAELDDKKRKEQMSRAGSGTRTNQTK